MKLIRILLIDLLKLLLHKDIRTPFKKTAVLRTGKRRVFFLYFLHNDTTTVFYYQFFITFLTARNH